MKNIEMTNQDREGKEDNIKYKLDLDGPTDWHYTIWSNMEIL